MQPTWVTRRVILRRFRFFLEGRVVARFIRLPVGFYCSEVRVFVNHLNASDRCSHSQVKRGTYTSAMYVSLIFASVKRRATSRVPSRRDSRSAYLRGIQVVAIRCRASRFRKALGYVLAFCGSALFFNNGQEGGHYLYFFHRFPPLSASRIVFCAASGFQYSLSQGVCQAVTQVVVFPVGQARRLQNGPIVVLHCHVTPREVLQARRNYVRLLSNGRFRPNTIRRGLLFIHVNRRKGFLYQGHEDLCRLKCSNRHTNGVFVREMGYCRSVIRKEEWLRPNSMVVRSLHGL